MKNVMNRFHMLRDTGTYLQNNSIISNFLFTYGTTVLAFLFFVDLVSAIIFFFHGTITSAAFYLGIIFTLMYVYKCAKKIFTVHWLPVAIIVTQLVFITFVSSFLISGHFYDLSYDGQAYHQEAVIRMKEGWNPFYKQYTPEEVPKVNVWINSYPKAAWIYEAVFYKVMGSIEYTKAGNFALIAAAFAITSAALIWLRFNPFLSIIVATFLSCNPVSIYQSLTFYIDGQLASLFNILLSLSLLVFFKKKSYLFIPLIMASVLLANMKFTGFLFVGIIYMALICLLFINYKDKTAVKMIFTGIVTLMLSGAVLGFNPYITNTVTMGNPFYPAAGKNAYDLVTPNIPQNYDKMSGAERFFVSSFAKSDSAKGENTYAQPKLPFSVSIDELKAFTLTYATEGSYGPLYSGLLILSVVILFFNTFLHFFKSVFLLPLKYVGFENITYQKRKYFTLPKPSLAAAILILLLFASILIVPVSSVGRYVPQGFLIPVVVILYAFTTKSIWKKSIGIVMLYILFINAMLITLVYFRYNQEHTAIVRQQLAQLREATQTKPISVYFDEFRSTRIRLAEANVRYIEIKKYKDCVGHYSLISDNISELCVPVTNLISRNK